MPPLLLASLSFDEAVESEETGRHVQHCLVSRAKSEFLRLLPRSASKACRVPNAKPYSLVNRSIRALLKWIVKNTASKEFAVSCDGAVFVECAVLDGINLTNVLYSMLWQPETFEPHEIQILRLVKRLLSSEKIRNRLPPSLRRCLPAKVAFFRLHHVHDA